MRCAGLLAFLLAVATGAGAPPANPRFTGTPLLRVWRAEDYGASPLNTRLLVHPNGLLYVANDEGLLEFDGESWRLIPLPRGGAARALARDSAGRVWVFGYDDAARLEPDARGELQAVSTLELLAPEVRATGTINRAAVTADGVYARGQRRLMLFHPDGTVQTWPGADLNGLVWTLGGALYADLGGLVRVSPAGVEHVSLGRDSAGSTADDLRVFATEASGDRAGESLLLTVRGPVRWRGPGTAFQPILADAAAIFGTDLVSAAVFLSDGRFAFGTERSGLFIFERDGGLSQHLDRTHGLPGNRINDLAVDAEGGLWLAMQEGLARLDLESPFAIHGEAQGLTGSARRFAAWKGSLYLATSEGVVRRDAASGRFTPIAGFQVGANRPLVVGRRLVASTRGLREITDRDQSRPWTTELIGPIVTSPRQPGWIYAGSSAGLSLIQPSKDGWKAAGRLSTLSVGLDELLERDDGWLWGVARTGEIARIDFRAGPRLDAPAALLTAAAGVPDTGRNEHVQLLTVGPDLLAVCADWLRRFDAATGRFVPEPRLALHGSAIAGVQVSGPTATGGGWFRPAEDPALLLRAETAGGGSWQVTERSIAPFSRAIFDSVFEEASSQTLWLVGQGVLASLDLGWKPTRVYPTPSVMIRGIESESGALLAGGLAPAGLLRLAAEDNALRIRYAAPSYGGDYRGRAQILYRTRLDGLDRDWSAWTMETHRDFTNLPYRRLSFHVQARAPDRPDGPETVLALAIAPPWWLDPWAFGGYAAIAAAALIGAFKVRTRALRRRNEQLERLVAVRTRQLERVNQELTDAVSIVSHDLRGSVSGIRAFARQLRATPRIWSGAEGPEYLGEIERTSGAVVDMMARLLDLQRASDRAAGLLLSAADVGAIVKDVCQQFTPAAAAKQIALQIEAPSAVRVVDAESVASIAANLISNAIKFLPADGRGALSVRLTSEAGVCRLTVADNGPGIQPGERDRLFEKFARGQAQPTAGEGSTGLGLFILKKLVTAMGGTIAVAETPGGGATFLVSWPAAEP